MAKKLADQAKDRLGGEAVRPRTVFRLTPVNPRPPLRAGEVLPVLLEQVVADYNGYDRRGPHPVGRAEVPPDGQLMVSITDHLEGRHAVAQLKDDLLDAVLFRGTVRLR